MWLLKSFVYLEKEQPMLAIREHLSIMTPRPIVWVTRFVMFQVVIFIIGCIFSLYQTQGLFKICAPVTDVTKYHLGKKTHQQIKNNYNLSIFSPSIEANLPIGWSCFLIDLFDLRL